MLFPKRVHERVLLSVNAAQHSFVTNLFCLKKQKKRKKKQKNRVSVFFFFFFFVFFFFFFFYLLIKTFTIKTKTYKNNNYLNHNHTLKKFSTIHSFQAKLANQALFSANRSALDLALKE
jgi:cell division protein YceG involved in septum cleavage